MASIMHSLLLFIVTCIADKSVYYILGTGSYIPADCDHSAPYTWLSEKNVYFLNDYDKDIRPWTTWVPKLIDIERGGAKKILDEEISWILTKDTTLSTTVKLQHKFQQILVSPIDSAYGGVYEAVYDDTMTTVKKVKKLVNWTPDVDESNPIYHNLHSIIDWLDNHSAGKGTVIFLSSLKKIPPMSGKRILTVAKPNVIIPEEEESVIITEKRDEDYNDRIGKLKTRAKEWFNKFKQKPHYDDFEKHIKTDGVFKYKLKALKEITEGTMSLDKLDPFYYLIPNVRAYFEGLKPYEKENAKFAHLEQLKEYLDDYEKYFPERYTIWSKKNNVDEAKVISGSNYPLVSDDDIQLHDKHKHHHQQKVSDNYYHEYGRYDHYDDISSYAVIIVMISLICICAGVVGCLLSIVMGIAIGSKYYKKHKYHTNQDIAIQSI